MRDIERLTEVTSRLTSKLPEVADTPVQVSPRFTQPIEPVDKVIDRPNVAKNELRWSPRLAGQQARGMPTQLPQTTQRVPVSATEGQPIPRVPVSATDGQASPRVLPSTTVEQPSPKVESTATKQQRFQQATTQSVQPVASRTRSAKLKAAAAEAGPARRTRSQTGNILERALHAACFVDNKSGSAQRLACKRCVTLKTCS